MIRALNLAFQKRIIRMSWKRLLLETKKLLDTKDFANVSFHSVIWFNEKSWEAGGKVGDIMDKISLFNSGCLANLVSWTVVCCWGQLIWVSLQRSCVVLNSSSKSFTCTSGLVVSREYRYVFVQPQVGKKVVFASSLLAKCTKPLKKHLYL